MIKFKGVEIKGGIKQLIKNLKRKALIVASPKTVLLTFMAKLQI